MRNLNIEKQFTFVIYVKYIMFILTLFITWTKHNDVIVAAKLQRLIVIIAMWCKTNVLMRQTSDINTEMLEFVCSFQSLHPNSFYLHCSWQANASNKRLICLFIIELVVIIWYATSHVNSNYLDNITSESEYSSFYLLYLTCTDWLIDWLSDWLIDYMC